VRYRLPQPPGQPRLPARPQVRRPLQRHQHPQLRLAAVVRAAAAVVVVVTVAVAVVAYQLPRWSPWARRWMLCLPLPKDRGA
jgi:hypothetical protein